MMKGDPMPIIVKTGTRPYDADTPEQVPLHQEEQVKSDLDHDVGLGVLEEVPINTPTTWCARMVVVPKQSGEDSGPPTPQQSFSKINSPKHVSF